LGIKLTPCLGIRDTLYGPDHSVSKWHAGLSIDSFPGETVGQRIANAAHSIGVDILSPAAVSSNGTGIDPEQQTYVPFTTREMIMEAHHNGLLVKPWTVSSVPFKTFLNKIYETYIQVNRLNIARELLDWSVDGLITDYPDLMRRSIQQVGKPVPPKFPMEIVLDCLDNHLQKAL